MKMKKQKGFLLNPFRFSGALPPSDQVTVSGQSPTVIVASNTAIVLAMPESILVGDILVATIMRRSSAASDPPAGWKLISQSPTASNNGGVSQTTYVYTKIYVASDASTTVTFSQSVAGRIIGKIISLRTTTGSAHLDQQQTLANSLTNVDYVDVPVITASNNGSLALVAASSVLAPTPPATAEWSYTNSFVGRSLNSVADQRLGMATKELPSGGNTSCRIQSALTGIVDGTAAFSANSVIFKPGAQLPFLVGSVGVGQSSDSSVTVAVPAGTADGDTLIAVIAVRGDRSATTTGWTELVNTVTGDTPTSDSHLYILTKPYAGETNISFPFSALGAFSFILASVRGSLSVSAQASSNTVNITPTVSGSLLLGIGFATQQSGSNSASWSAPMTHRGSYTYTAPPNVNGTSLATGSSSGTVSESISYSWNTTARPHFIYVIEIL